ncbi:MAG: helix-turn-helix domain-containing protein [Cyclobacteriaceae bacterium]
MTVLRYLLFLYSLSSIFISGGLFFQKKGRSQLMLSLFALLFGLEMLDYLYSTSRFVLVFPDFYGIYYFMVGFIYGPVLWFHFSGLVYPENKFSYGSLLHFVPFILSIIYFGDVLTLSGAERMVYTKAHFYDRLMPMNYARAGHLLLYGIGFIIFIYNKRQLLTLNNRLFAMIICAIYFITAVIVSWLTLFADHWRQFIVYYFLASSMVFIMGYILYSKPNFLNGIAKKYLHSGLDTLMMQRIVTKIELEFFSKKAFLNRDLTLVILAEQINEKPHFISQTLSSHVGENFNDFVNRYRIEYAKSLLRDKKYAHFKIEAIASESGFNNKVTFNKAFSKFVATTPSAFRDAV